MIAKDGPEGLTEKVDDLLVFVMSERYARLRRQIGIAIE
jgi:hypothetical protein